MYQRLKRLTNEYKILRGMLSYGTLWPIGNLLEQTLVEKRNIHTYDWQKCMRISLHGTLFMGPMMFMWMRFVSRLYPGRSLRSSVSKAISEQVTFDPMAIVVFLFVMTVAEGNSAAMAREEVRERSREHYVVQKPYKCVLICVHPHGIAVASGVTGAHQVLRHVPHRSRLLAGRADVQLYVHSGQESGRFYQLLQHAVELVPGVHEAPGAGVLAWLGRTCVPLFFCCSCFGYSII